jgi:hypothetical protein
MDAAVRISPVHTDDEENHQPEQQVKLSTLTSAALLER